jgi:hypothetical protein
MYISQLTLQEKKLKIFRIFRRVRKITKSDYWLRHVCRSTWNDLAPTGRTFMKFDIRRFFSKCVEKVQVSLKSDKNNGTSHEDLRTFMRVSR